MRNKIKQHNEIKLIVIAAIFLYLISSKHTFAIRKVMAQFISDNISIESVEPALQIAVNRGVSAIPAPLSGTGSETRSWFVYNNLKQGDVIRDKILVINNNKEPVTAKIYPVDAIEWPNSAFTLGNEDEIQKEIGKWIKLPINEIYLESGQKKLVPFTLTLPASLPNILGYTGAIAVADKNQQSNTINTNTNLQVTIKTRVGVRIYINLLGERVISYNIGNIYLDENITNTKAIFNVEIENRGNVRLHPIITAEAQNKDGSLIATLHSTAISDLNPGPKIALPIYWNNWQEGEYNIQFKIRLNKEDEIRAMQIKMPAKILQLSNQPIPISSQTIDTGGVGGGSAGGSGSSGSSKSGADSVVEEIEKNILEIPKKILQIFTGEEAEIIEEPVMKKSVTEESANETAKEEETEQTKPEAESATIIQEDHEETISKPQKAQNFTEEPAQSTVGGQHSYTPETNEETEEEFLKNLDETSQTFTGGQTAIIEKYKSVYKYEKSKKRIIKDNEEKKEENKKKQSYYSAPSKKPSDMKSLTDAKDNEKKTIVSRINGAISATAANIEATMVYVVSAIIIAIKELIKEILDFLLTR